MEEGGLFVYCVGDDGVGFVVCVFVCMGGGGWFEGVWGYYVGVVVLVGE